MSNDILIPVTISAAKVLFIVGCSKRQMIALTFFLPITKTITKIARKSVKILKFASKRLNFSDFKG